MFEFKIADIVRQYRQKSVIYGRIPQTDGNESWHYAVIVADCGDDNVVILPITSKHNPADSYEYELTDDAGIKDHRISLHKSPSENEYVKIAKPQTVNKNKIHSAVGYVSEKDWAHILALLLQLVKNGK